VRLDFKLGFLFLYCFLVFFSGLKESYGQSTNDLDKKKKDNIQQLAYSKKLLEKTALSKTSTLNQINLIQRNIELRTGLIENITDELGFLKNDIEANNLEIKKIDDRIKSIKGDYANLIIAASRNLDNEYAMMYILSSQDFNQAYQRIKYLKYLARYRMELTEKLETEQENLKNKNIELAENKNKNERLLAERKKEIASLDRDKKENLSLVRSLQNKETELKREIQKRERIQDEIEKEIRKIIEEEEAKARLAKKTNMLTAEEKIISADFSRNIGRLPWPSEQGVLIGKYGEQNHPVLKGIKIRSNGIDINTVEGETTGK